MIVVGEKLNSSRISVERAIKASDADFIRTMARAQVEAGADALDINAGTFLEEEQEKLTWMIRVVQDEVDVPLCIDTANLKILQNCLEISRTKVIVNSIKLASSDFRETAELIRVHEASVIAMAQPHPEDLDSADRRLDAALEIVDRLSSYKISRERILIDPMVHVVSLQPEACQITLRTIDMIRREIPDCNIIAAISNASFGLPARRVINGSFLTLCMYAGLNAAIVDPLDKHLMFTMLATEVVLGRDRDCKKFLAAVRKVQGAI